MKIARIILLSIALVPYLSNANEETDKLLQSSFRLTTVHSKDHFYLMNKGTAFGVDLSEYGFKGKKFLLTAGHNVRSMSDIKSETTIEIKEDVWINCKIVRLDEDLDLAILEADKEIPVLKLSKEDVKTGKDVVMASSPSGQPIRIFKGKVLKRWESSSIFTKVEIELDYGDSGSAVICSNGKVVGVIVAGLKVNDKLDTKFGLFVPISVIQTFLEEKDR